MRHGFAVLMVSILGALPAQQPRINPNGAEIQETRYRQKRDWVETPKYRQYIEQHGIKRIRYKHYEKD